MATLKSAVESIASLQNKIGQLEKAMILLATWTNLDLSRLRDLGIIHEEGEKNPLVDCVNEAGSSTPARSLNGLARKSTKGLPNRIKNQRYAGSSRQTLPLGLTFVKLENAFKSEGNINPIITLDAADFGNDDDDDPKYMPSPLPINGCTSSDDSDNEIAFCDGGINESSVKNGSKNEDNDSLGIGIVNVKSLAGVEMLSSTDLNRPFPYVCLNKLTDDILKTQYKIKISKKRMAKKEVLGSFPQFCKICDNVELKSNTELLEHRRKMHKRLRQLYKCDVCDSGDVTFKQKSKYLQHMNQHTKKTRKMYTCEICNNYTSTHKSKVADHATKHTNERPYLCYVCAGTFKTLSGLNTHLKIHSTNIQKDFKCSDCDKAFERKMRLIQHQKKVHMIDNDLKVECSICEIVLADKDKYKRHVSAVHEEERKFNCHLCGQAFKRTTHLRVHIMRHSNPKRRKRGPQRSILYRNKEKSDAAVKITESENLIPDSEPSETSTPSVDLQTEQKTCVAKLSPSLDVEIDNNLSNVESESKSNLDEGAVTVSPIPHSLSP